MFVRFLKLMMKLFPKLNLNYLADPITAYRRGQKLFRDDG